MPLDYSRLLNKPKLAEIKTLICICVWVIIEPKGQSSDLCHQISLLPLLLIYLCTTKNEYPEIKDACHYKKPLADYFFPYYISTTYQSPIAVRQNNFSKEVKRENNWEKCEVRETFGLAKNILIGAHSTPNQQHYNGQAWLKIIKKFLYAKKSRYLFNHKID